MKKNKECYVFAPATVANVSVGFDILGFALKNIGEVAKVSTLPKNEVEIIVHTNQNLESASEQISLDPKKNTAGAGLLEFIKDKKIKIGFRVELYKSIPVGSGLGGSSTSAVAAIKAAEYLTKKKLSEKELLKYALIGEAVASGSQHADNIGPCLKGGLVFTSLEELITIKTPKTLQCVVLLPKIQIKTKEARSILEPKIDFKKSIQQTQNIAGFILGCIENRLDLIQKYSQDLIIEPQRQHLIPHFNNFKQTALDTGALMMSISGSGPAIFCLTKNRKHALTIKKNWLDICKSQNLTYHNIWITQIDSNGARIITSKKAKELLKR